MASVESKEARELRMLSELVEKMAKAIVKHPELVKVSEVWSKHTLIIHLSVAHVDRGKVIGKRGQNINAIRTILATAARYSTKRIELEVDA